MGTMRICFGYQTAFQILRTIRMEESVAARGRIPDLPDRAPSAEELAYAIEQLRSLHPNIRIDYPVHILVSSAKHRRYTFECKEHVCSVSLRGRSFYRLSKGMYVAAPALAFVQVASCEKNLIALHELAYELCGTYQTQRTGVAASYDARSLSSVRDLRGFVSTNHSIDGARKVKRILRYAADNSASARETKQALVLGLPHMRGGYGLGIPCMNYEVKANAAARAITGKSRFRCDLCWPAAKLDVEYQSKESHEGETSRIGDSRRANALKAMGWTVVGITNDELDSLVATDTIADTIRRHLGRRPQVRVSNYHARKLKLRRQLGLPVGYD